MREKRLSLHTVIPISTDRVNFNCLFTTDLLLKREREREIEEGEIKIEKCVREREKLKGRRDAQIHRYCKARQ